MVPYQKYFVFLYITFITIGYVHGTCDTTLKHRKCIYQVNCRFDFQNIHRTNYYRYHELNRNNYDVPPAYDYNDENNDETDEVNPMNRMPETCNSIIPVTYYNNYGQNNYYPVHMKFTPRPNEPIDIPRLDISGIITCLDLSGNNFNVIPEISIMENLAQLNLSRNALTVAELSNREDISSLTEIDLSHNNIRDVSYKSTHVYSNLKRIDLSYNFLTQITEKMFKPFTELQTLDISHNFIEILTQKTFEGMGNLINLNISYNRISDINSSLFRFDQLKLLDLSNNYIKTIVAADLNILTNLKSLDLSNNLISVIDKETFNNIPFLESLSLKNNKIPKLDKDIFCKSTLLSKIDLSENVFERIPKNLFKGTRIRVFSIEDNQLKGTLEKGMFEGLTFVNKLDITNQNLESIEDFAFFGLNQLSVLLLNNNNISVLTGQSFATLNSLKRLDLSYNSIQYIKFDKSQLYSLVSFSLRNNRLTTVKKEDFHGLNSLQFLDLSDNKITQLETNSFASLQELINFQISNNPLIGTLQENTFDGLNSLPSLDISCTLLSTVQNGTFTNMTQLKNLNASHSKINSLEYNVFIHTGAIETIDLSFNGLKEFVINSTELANLNTLYLNNNLLKTLDFFTFRNMLVMNKLMVSRNMIQNLNADIFMNLIYLRTLDFSYNQNLNITMILLNKTRFIESLDLSGIRTNVSFGIKDINLKYLTISNSNVINVKSLQLNELHRLDNLILSNNKIVKLVDGGFNNLSTLRYLDLSHNKINYIQPGIFADNTMLISLDISHNLLTALSYGIFRGLIYLSTLDISYNRIDNLQNERFYEVNSLSVLIADHNKIESITAEEFVGTSLTELSIGGNPIPCDIFVNLERRGVPFKITARNLYENNEENVNGVTCNRILHSFDRITNISDNAADNTKVLLSIRDIILEHFKNDQNIKPTATLDDNYLSKISDDIQTSNADLITKISTIVNVTSDVKISNDETNKLLNKMLRVLTLSSGTRPPPVQVTKDNATYENLLSYINKIKQELDDTFKLDKESILSEVDAKITAIKFDKETILNEVNAKISSVNTAVGDNIMLSSESPRHEKLSASVESQSLFTETCVALILVILVGFVLFKVYKSGIFVRRRFSVSTRELPGSMDSPL